jgi:hypothetical protein
MLKSKIIFLVGVLLNKLDLSVLFNQGDFFMKTKEEGKQLSLFDDNNNNREEVVKEVKVISLKEYHMKKSEERFKSYSDHLL